MIRKPASIKTRWVLGVTSFVVLAALYTGLSYRQHQINPNDTTIPSWGQLADGLTKVFTPQGMGRNGEPGEIWVWIDSKATFMRLFAGLALAVILSVLAGIMMGCYASVEAVLFPPLSVLSRIPATAMLAVVFALVGTDFRMYVAMIAIGVLPTLTQAVYQAAKRDVPDELVFKSLTLGATSIGLIWHVVTRQILPRVLDAVRLQIGPAMVFLIAAEWMLGEPGFGYRLRMQSRLLQMNVVYVYLVLLGLSGYAIDLILVYLRRKLCPWYEQHD